MTLSGKQFAGTLRNEIRYVALLLTLCFASVALSSELPRLYVRPGENIVVARSEKEIELNASSSQDVKLTSDAAVNTQAKLWVLSFKAPPEKDTSEVSVVYSIGTDKYSVIIQVSATPEPDSATLASAATMLGQMLVIAIIMESAFAVIFNWRVFLEFFDGRGVRTVVMFIGGWIVATVLHQDFVGSLFDIYLRTGGGNDQHSTWITQVLTALVLAGGSASVNQLFVALNLREAKTIETVTEKVPPNKAWIAIKVMNIKKGDKVLIVDAANGEAATAATEHLVGVMPAAGFGERLKKYFWRDRNRLPMSRGFVVDPEKEYAFVIRRTRANSAGLMTENFDLAGRSLTYVPPIDPATGQPVNPDPHAGEDPGGVSASELSPAPRRYSFVKSAIVDFRVTLPA
ncbi:hypothetical protein [Rhizobium ruizarguesonis]|uniref:hypothetical protein n=1 Tax=Rhizobium ruizarguesonis TaxID=2081791 RepID=UPI00040007C4|nr:hypothetical protein [Rhizobium ruizarguesonis]QJS31296.1 hypothetical protein RLTA1_28675 [Rhizobium leguminosarum bv. trifolii TA1]TAW02679.1 hypothetical protein ELI25_36425 [Rhizobium ruizarguesonis]TAZ44248.1 hypothetical protein ELH76_35915 [Rhizobium ruizarguesonis]TBB35879.1 hypothetical protein ELH49_36870 [Rhizobium ruizarguesonis]UFW98109.1 hypothetical protein RlegTA1_28620 [Rhizobium ruizarguesonis]